MKCDGLYMIDKVQLLVEETGCDPKEAELALQLCGYELEKAVKMLPGLIKDIVVFKGKFSLERQGVYGVLLVIVNLKTHSLVRAKAVISYNPSVYLIPLEGEWFEYEKHLYRCRLWEGSLQGQSQELEQLIVQTVTQSSPAELTREDSEQAFPFFYALLSKSLGSPENLKLLLKKEKLDLGQLQLMKRDLKEPAPVPVPSGEKLILRVALDADPQGIRASQLRAGDTVAAEIIDPRDIAQYLAKLLGGRTQEGLIPLLAPVESVKTADQGKEAVVQVRFSSGVCGQVRLPADIKIKVIARGGLQEPGGWWKKWMPE